MQRGDLILKEGMNVDNTPIVKSLKLLEDLVQECIKTGVFNSDNKKDYKHYVRVIWSVVHGVSSLYIAMPMLYTEEEIMEVAKISVEMNIKGLKK